MSTTIINPLAQASLAVANAQIPAEGPKCVPVPVDFTSVTSYTFDYSQQMRAGYLSMVQTLYIDASLLSADVTIVIGTTGQVITAKSGTQGYYPVLAPNPFKMTLTSSGAATCPIYLINVPIAPGVWSV